MVRYRTTGGRSSRRHEQSFGTDLREAEDFALKVEHDKRAHVFVDPKAGRVLFRDAAGTWLDQHLGADSSIATYRSVLRAHIDPVFGGKPIGTIRREDIKTLIAAMHRKGLSASRIGCAHLVVSAVLAEAVRDKKLAESPCTGIQLPGVVTAADFILPAHAQVEAVAAGLPPDWAATVWLMHGCGLRIGEALAVSLRCRISKGKTLPIREQVDPNAQLRPLKFRKAGHPAAGVRQRGGRQARHRAWHHARRVPVPGTQVQARRPPLLPGGLPALTRRTSSAPPPRRACRRSSSPTTCATSTPRRSLAEGIPITEVSRWLGHKSIEVTHQIYGHLVPNSFDRARTALDHAYQASRR